MFFLYYNVYIAVGVLLLTKWGLETFVKLKTSAEVWRFFQNNTAETPCKVTLAIVPT